ncbi:aldehyde dehydrogenase [Streptomyces chiangmaiensis]|uniref:Aldehyde dehydrogenase n=1 Tax=Streptomyces chiangmaiensis TaxID=766497 RepID=A0ABU7FMC6_9ACTN|nr:aldehyde dehydrogenase [Streptomyces chiangmaiensis]MED7825257.1 aldehyde dehydrogenase [Streptomyces chiangmaiensis]
MTDSTTPLKIDTDRTTMYVNGAWRPSHGQDRMHEINPATEEVIGFTPDGDAEDIDAAVQAARAALREWAGLTPVQRSAFLVAMADRLDQRADQAARLVTSENGVPLATSAAMVESASGVLRYYASLAETFPFEEARGTTVVRQEPIGVAGLILPWNGPLNLAYMKIAPALLAGCTTVLKPAPETSLSTAFIADAAEAAALPAGVINIVTGGREAGAALVTHAGVDKIAFTGSTAAGRAIAAQCGQAMKPGTFELGGKSASILLDDADLDVFLAQIIDVSLAGSGQSCKLSTRILVASDRYDEVCDALRNTLSPLVVGDPFDPATDFGPLAIERQRDRVEQYIRSGLEQGAKLLMGGGRPTHLPKGYYVEPTVFVGVENWMRIAQEEIFGPVLAVIPFDSDDDAVTLANDSAYGLGGAVYTTDTERGTNIARRVQTGTIGINGYRIDPLAPFGGYKQSGLGRELGPEGLAAYLQNKSIYHAVP